MRSIVYIENYDEYGDEVNSGIAIYDFKRDSIDCFLENLEFDSITVLDKECFIESDGYFYIEDEDGNETEESYNTKIYRLAQNMLNKVFINIPKESIRELEVLIANCVYYKMEQQVKQLQFLLKELVKKFEIHSEYIYEVT